MSPGTLLGQHTRSIRHGRPIGYPRRGTPRPPRGTLPPNSHSWGSCNPDRAALGAQHSVKQKQTGFLPQTRSPGQGSGAVCLQCTAPLRVLPGFRALLRRLLWVLEGRNVIRRRGLLRDRMAGGSHGEVWEPRNITVSSSLLPMLSSLRVTY